MGWEWVWTQPTIRDSRYAMRTLTDGIFPSIVELGFLICLPTIRLRSDSRKICLCGCAGFTIVNVYKYRFFKMRFGFHACIVIKTRVSALENGGGVNAFHSATPLQHSSW